MFFVFKKPVLLKNRMNTDFFKQIDRQDKLDYFFNILYMEVQNKNLNVLSRICITLYILHSWKTCLSAFCVLYVLKPA